MTSAAPILQDLSGIIKSVAEWFDGLDDNTRKTIVHIAAIGVVAGPAVSWFGKIQKAVGTVTDGFGKGIKHVGTDLLLCRYPAGRCGYGDVNT